MVKKDSGEVEEAARISRVSSAFFRKYWAECEEKGIKYNHQAYREAYLLHIGDDVAYEVYSKVADWDIEGLLSGVDNLSRLPEVQGIMTEYGLTYSELEELACSFEQDIRAYMEDGILEGVADGLQ